MHRPPLALLALFAFAAPSTAAGHNGSICDWVLERTAAQSILDSPVRDFLTERTALFDIMNGKASFEQENAPYRDFYARENEKPATPVDFNTESAVIHADSASDSLAGCIRIDGRLSGKGTSDGTHGGNLTFRDESIVPVTLFVYGSGAFFQDAREGKGKDATNVRVKVGSLDLVPEPSRSGDSMGASDPFQTFFLSAYIAHDQGATITGSASIDGTQRSDGEHVWFVGNIGDDGPQLLAAICDGPCIDFQKPRVKMPQYHANAETAGLDASRKQDGMESGTEVGDTTDFAGETLILRDATTDQEIDFSLLKDSTADMEDHVRAIVEIYLDKLGGAEASDALDELSKAGLVDIRPEDWEFEAYERRHMITLRPARPERLTAVRVVLSKPARSAILRNCVPKVEIAHAEHDSTVRPMTLDLDSKLGDKYKEFVVRLNGDDPVLAQSPETLSLRIFIESGPGEAPSCKLTWNALFPEDTFRLADSAASMSGRFSLNSAGEAVFSEVELASTQRAAYILIFNKTGPVDENGQPTSADVYPDWNSEIGGDELAEALTRFMRAAHAAYSNRTSAVFTLTGEDPIGKDFGGATPLTDDRMQNEVVNLLDGSLGIESLNFAIKKVTQREDEPPIVLVIGRSGLKLGSNYCASAPDIPATARKGSVVVDFVPSIAVSDLPSETHAALEPDSGSELPDAIVRRMPAARCPKSGPDEFDHWVLAPDDKIRGWPKALDSLATLIFAGTK